MWLYPDVARARLTRSHLAYCGAILLRRRLLIMKQRSAGLDTRADEAALAELEEIATNIQIHWQKQSTNVLQATLAAIPLASAAASAGALTRMRRPANR